MDHKLKKTIHEIALQLFANHHHKDNGILVFSQTCGYHTSCCKGMVEVVVLPESPRLETTYPTWDDNDDGAP